MQRRDFLTALLALGAGGLTWTIIGLQENNYLSQRKTFPKTLVNLLEENRGLVKINPDGSYSVSNSKKHYTQFIKDGRSAIVPATSVVLATYYPDGVSSPLEDRARLSLSLQKIVADSSVPIAEFIGFDEEGLPKIIYGYSHDKNETMKIAKHKIDFGDHDIEIYLRVYYQSLEELIESLKRDTPKYQKRIQA